MNTNPPQSSAVAVGAPEPSGFYQPEHYRPEDSLGWLMKSIVTSIGNEVQQRLCDQGPTFPQWAPLYMLSRGDASTVAELARACQLDNGAMTRLLDRLESKGLCRRVRSTLDRRVVNVELTAQGRQSVEQIPALLCQVQNEHLAGFSDQECRLLLGLLRRMWGNARLPETGPRAQDTTGEQHA